MLARMDVFVAAMVMAGGLCAGTCDATPAEELAAKGEVFIKFQPAKSAAPEGALVSDGSLYSEKLGLGWDQDLRSQARVRSGDKTAIVLLDRGVSLATFTVDLPNGDYLFEVTALDTDYAGALVPVIDGDLAARPTTYAMGQKVTADAAVTSRNGKARISLLGGRDGFANSTVSSIRIVPAATEPERWQEAEAVVDSYRMERQEKETARIARKQRQRASYTPVGLSASSSGRKVYDLARDWLFMPTQEMDSPAQGSDPRADDTQWHVLEVPQFWQPNEWWIYVFGRGTSHNYMRKEVDRCLGFTFDYGATRSGWYRQWVDVPKSLAGRRIVTRFEGVASIAEVYWNGKPVGSHVGMFGPFECDATREVRFGERNLLAVFVSAGRIDPAAAKEVAAVAVTMDITHEMLSSLPHGGHRIGLGGIWQPVKLEVTAPDRIADVFFRPWLDGASIETTVDRSSAGALEVVHTLVDAATGKVLHSDSRGSAAGESAMRLLGSASVARTEISGMRPKLWSPEHPNLYELKTQLVRQGKVVDEKRTTVGFRTFEVRGRRLYLNGKPYFMRAANMPPHGIAPTDSALAHRFMKLMHDGNTMVTRFHGTSCGQAWMDACDKQGVGASIEGNWPWMLITSSPIPDRELLAAWKNEFEELVRAHRNHPSLLFWTISNESHFQGLHESDQARKLEKFRIFSDMISTVRALDPDKPIVFHSDYIRVPDDYEKIIKPNNLDDGDIDDGHHYYGWYWRSPMHVDVVNDIENHRDAGTRPLISQEASTGYPDNDTGHPTESYIKLDVPQAWVGSHSLYSARPDMFLETQARITREYAEKVRRERTYISGWSIFNNGCWFRDVYDADLIAPYPVYWEVRKAYQPVLVSIETHDRHFEAGSSFETTVYVVHDDPDRDRLTDLTLRWRICGKSDDRGTSGTVRFPDCEYDGKSTLPVRFELPSTLPVERSNARLELELRQGDEVISKNDYALVCARQEWYTADTDQRLIVLDPGGTATTYLRSIGLDCEMMTKLDWAGLEVGRAVVIAPGVSPSALEPVEAFAGFVERGGQVLMLEPIPSDVDPATLSAIDKFEHKRWSRLQPDLDPRKSALAAIPGLPLDQVKIVKAEGEYVELLAGDLRSGIDPMDMHWWNAAPGDVVRVCRVSYQVPDEPGVVKLARHIDPHGYVAPAEIPSLTSWPVLEFSSGKGRVVISSLALADDLVARRFMRNLVAHTLR